MRTNALWIGMILLSVMCAPVMADWVDKSWDFNGLTADQSLSSQDSSWTNTSSTVMVRGVGTGNNAIGPAAINTYTMSRATIADVDYGTQYEFQISAYTKSVASGGTTNVSIMKSTTFGWTDILFQFGIADGNVRAFSLSASNSKNELFTAYQATADTWYDIKVVYTVAADGSSDPDTVQGFWKLSSGTTWTGGTAIDVASNHMLNRDASNYLATGLTAKESTLAAYVDNISLTAIPEPATMGLLAVGGLGVLLRRKRV